MILSDSKIVDDTEHRATSLRQPSLLLDSYQQCQCHFTSASWIR